MFNVYCVHIYVLPKIYYFKLIYRADSDEIKEMQIRTATSCLYATATFLNSLPEEHIENIESELKSMLLTNSTYWKLNKHPTPSVCYEMYFY